VIAFRSHRLEGRHRRQRKTPPWEGMPVARPTSMLKATSHNSSNHSNNHRGRGFTTKKIITPNCSINLYKAGVEGVGAAGAAAEELAAASAMEEPAPQQRSAIALSTIITRTNINRSQDHRMW